MGRASVAFLNPDVGVWSTSRSRNSRTFTIPEQESCFWPSSRTGAFLPAAQVPECQYHSARSRRATPGWSRATCFGVGDATAGLRDASEFLFSIDNGRAWDQFQELFKTPAVLGKFDKHYEWWIAEATDASSDIRRAKELLKQALQQQAPQVDDKPATDEQ
mmetsp:Transcript_32911/g.61675  ORF Transcript_32911/g.61675 Transcript_32911/m.61675 type:complete len:161 (+) Transcript_32911:81-563(+)